MAVEITSNVRREVEPFATRHAWKVLLGKRILIGLFGVSDMFGGSCGSTIWRKGVYERRDRHDLERASDYELWRCAPDRYCFPQQWRFAGHSFTAKSGYLLDKFPQRRALGLVCSLGAAPVDAADRSFHQERCPLSGIWYAGTRHIRISPFGVVGSLSCAVLSKVLFTTKEIVNEWYPCDSTSSLRSMDVPRWSDSDCHWCYFND
jgi:hypothetical protein